MEGLGPDPAVGDNARWQRAEGLTGVGPAGIARLRAARFLVVGAGGLGSAVLPLIAAQGPARITLYDDDRVEETNLARQLLFTPHDIGRCKAEVAAERIRALTPQTEVQARTERLSTPNKELKAEAYDVILDCTDNFSSRFTLNTLAATIHVPLIYGAVEAYAGQVTVLHARREVSLTDIIPPSCAHTPPGAKEIFPPVVQAIGAVMAAEALKLVLGIESSLDGGLLHLDLLRNQSGRIELMGPAPRTSIASE